MNPWITIPEAMTLVGRGRTQIYRWAQQGLVRTRRNENNLLLIDAAHLIEIEPTVTRGRRPGTARPNQSQ